MYSHMYQIEDRFVQTQRDIQIEIEDIRKINQALARAVRKPLLRQALHAAGLRLVRVGTQLVEKYPIAEERQGRSQAAGLA